MPIRILHLDDNIEFCECLRTSLDPNKFIVHHAKNNNEGIELLTSKALDIIISDFFLQEGTATNFIKSASIERSSTPLVVFSSTEEQVVQEEVQCYSAFISKLKFGELVSFVESFEDRLGQG